VFRKLKKTTPNIARITVSRCLFFSALLLCEPLFAQTSLRPETPDLSGIINNEVIDGKSGQEWAIVLGKALFWDQQAGSDGVACASCHYSAGADIRITNQLEPGARDITVAANGDIQFGATRSDTLPGSLGTMPSGALAQPNYTLTADDFPLHRTSDMTDRQSAINTTTNDIVSSQGAFDAEFLTINGRTGRETCSPADATVFHASGFAARQVALRNSATTINAVFNRRNLWDGSANFTFNGVGGFGMRDINGDPNARLLVMGASNQVELGFVALPYSSLASQAVGPVVNDVEMSCSGRTLPHVGRKLMASSIRPLGRQIINANDSVFAGLVDPSGRGLLPNLSYVELVKKSFDAKYWSGSGYYLINNGSLQSSTQRLGFSQMEYNWSLFWGLAIQLYESTLISNVSEFDELVRDRSLVVRDIRTGPPFGCSLGQNANVDPLLLRGCQIFFHARDDSVSPPGGGCNNCHGGRDVFTGAANAINQASAPLARIGTELDTRTEPPGMIDLGFQNTGVRPVFTDLRLGGTDPYGNPLSYSIQYKGYIDAIAAGQTQEQALQGVVDPELVTAIIEDEVLVTNNTLTIESRVHAAGAAKTPGLRNVSLTPPYTSSGTYATLREMVKFYNRGGNRRKIDFPGDPDANGTACEMGDNSGSGPDGLDSYEDLVTSGFDCHTNVTLGIGALGLLDCDLEENDCDPATDDIAAVVRFLTSLTDPRVQCDAAPFDHPSLVLTVGHRDSDNNSDGRADDKVFQLPEVGAGGYDPTSGFCLHNSGNLFAPGMQARAGGALVPLSN